jgi:hypothetical protein
VVVVEVLVGAVVVVSAVGAGAVDGAAFEGVGAGSDAVVGSSGVSAAGSIATAWLHADARRQAPITRVIRGKRTMDNLQMVDRRRDVFRGCSPTTHSAGRGSKP